jgi:hypothetical protein
VLELEVICLEKHLLTLYRKAFEQQLSPVNSACDAENNKQPARSFSGILSEASVLSFSTPRKHQPVQSSRMVLARKSTPAASTSEASSEKMNIGRSHSSLLHRSVRVSPSANNLARALKPCHTSPLSFVEVQNDIPPFLFSCRWIVQFCTIQRQLKRNGGSISEISLVPKYFNRFAAGLS